MLRYCSSIPRCSANQGCRHSALKPAGTSGHCNSSSSSRGCCGRCNRGKVKAPKGPLNPDTTKDRKAVAPPPEAIGIFYSTSTGNTEEVAGIIKDALGSSASDPVDIGDVTDLGAALTAGDLDGLIVGAPTWNTGAAEGRSGTAWDNIIDQIKELDLQGRKVAVYGLGDQYGYSDYFCDAIEELHSAFAAAGADMVGNWPTDGYDFSDSKAVVDGKFCGLALDQDNQDDLTEQRVQKWTSQLLDEMNLK